MREENTETEKGGRGLMSGIDKGRWEWIEVGEDLLSFIYSVVKSILRIYRVLGTEPNAENMVNKNAHNPYPTCCSQTNERNNHQINEC